MTNIISDLSKHIPYETLRDLHTELEELSYTQDCMDNELFTAIELFYSYIDDSYLEVCN